MARFAILYQLGAFGALVCLVYPEERRTQAARGRVVTLQTLGDHFGAVLALLISGHSKASVAK